MISRTLSEHAGQRTFALVFETDDEVLATLRAFLHAHGIRAGRFQGIGAFRGATLAYFDCESKEYREIPVAEQVEVTSLLGTIASKDGEPKVHAHCVLGRPDGSTLAGHLMEATVRPTLELFLTAADAELPRRPDAESGLDLIRF